jgi:hypothetical protein
VIEAILHEPEIVVELEVVALDTPGRLATGGRHGRERQSLPDPGGERGGVEEGQEDEHRGRPERGAAAEPWRLSVRPGRRGRHRRGGRPEQTS